MNAAITRREIQEVLNRINKRLSTNNTYFDISIHVREERLNDPRNVPSITAMEIEDILNRLIDIYLIQLCRLENGDHFNIKCSTSHINMPCSVEVVENRQGKQINRNFILTIMRKVDFLSKDSLEFIV